MEHGGRILAAARAEADAVLPEAYCQAHRRLADKVFDRAAAIGAAEIEDRAWRNAEATRRQADQEAAEWLRSLHARGPGRVPSSGAGSMLSAARK